MGLRLKNSGLKLIANLFVDNGQVTQIQDLFIHFYTQEKPQSKNRNNRNQKKHQKNCQRH